MRAVAFLAIGLILSFPSVAFACRNVIPPMTEQQKLALADIIVIGTVAEMKEASDLEKEMNWPQVYRISMNIQKYLKGSGPAALQLVDTRGTDCDPEEAHIPLYRNPLSGTWRVFIGKRKELLWVDHAERSK